MRKVYSMMGRGVPRIADVFAPYIYTGNRGANTIVNGVNLAGGGMVLFKIREVPAGSGSPNWACYDSTRNGTAAIALLEPNTTAAGKNVAGTSAVVFNSNGFTLASDTAQAHVNYELQGYASWSFRRARNFFYVASATVTGGTDASVNLGALGTVGMVWVKQNNGIGAWFSLHRSNTAGKLCYVNTTDAETTNGSVTLSGTTLTLKGGTIADGNYTVWAWAHEEADDGLIECGSFNTDGSGNGSIDTGKSTQFLMLKCLSAAGDWEIYDTVRTPGFTGNDARLRLNTSDAEDAVGRISVSGTALSFAGLTASKTYAYMQIVAP